MNAKPKIFDPFQAVQDATARGRAVMREMIAANAPTSEQAREFANEKTEPKKDENAD